MVEAIMKRKSVRKYQSKKVEAEKIENILRAAMQAPSAMNGQPWEFVVVDDTRVLDKIRNFSIGAHALKEEYSAPAVIVVLERELAQRKQMNMTFLSAQDLGACTENLWLQAVEEGLGASWMGVMPGSESQSLLSKELNLPENIKAFAVIAIGYPAEDVNLVPEDRYDETRVHYNTYK